MKPLLWITLVFGTGLTATSARADDAATAKVYASQCATCHGADGKGQTKVGKQIGTQDWSDPKTLKAMSDVDVEKIISVGKKMMPAYKKLGEPQIKALVAYIRTFQPK